MFHHHLLVYWCGAGSILVLTALIIPQVLDKPRIMWDKLGNLLGIINSHIILFLLFFVIITPIAFVLRLTKKNLLGLKINGDAATYWQPSATTEGSSLKQQF